jgi:hypothetical protein
MCKAGGEFNLSFESLTSRDALHLLRDVEKNDPDTWKKISSRENLEKEPEEQPFSAIEEDDSNVPVAVLEEYLMSDHQVLRDGYAIGQEGDILANQASEQYGEEIEAEALVEDEDLEEFGRGKRRRVANQQYSAFWRHYDDDPDSD